MSVAVLLGAGASADAGIPTTREMTDAVIARMEDVRHRRILLFVRHTIAADLARERPEIPRVWNQPVEIEEDVDVERLFASVDLLVDRKDQAWSPFVATWHPGLESFSPAPRVRESDLFSELNNFERALNSWSRASSSYSAQGAAKEIARALARVVEGAIRRTSPIDVSELLAVAAQCFGHSSIC